MAGPERSIDGVMFEVGQDQIFSDFGIGQTDAARKARLLRRFDPDSVGRCEFAVGQFKQTGEYGFGQSFYLKGHASSLRFGAAG